MPLPEDFAKCLVLNTIAAARTMLRRYDAQFKHVGVTVQQFSLLAAIRYLPGTPVIALAQRVAMDRTSLTRSLNLLEGKGLIRRVPGPSGNARLCALTEAGDAVLDTLLPQWQAAQAELGQGITPEDAETYLRVAKHLAQE